MITRRHIRIKVMQSLYSYFSSNNDIAHIQKDMIKSINRISDLHSIIISLLIEIRKYALIHFEERKMKYFPTNEDLEPNMKFVQNSVFSLFLKDEEVIKRNKRFSRIWKKDELDLTRKIFLNIIKSDQYKVYLNSNVSNLEEDKNFIKVILSNFLLDNTIFHHILKEKDIFWIDDLPFVSVYLINQIDYMKLDRDNSIMISEVFKNKDDKNFAVKLFRETISNNQYFDNLIDVSSNNWELDRIANMDILLIKMSLAEILSFKEMPIKVSFNEYIEISKYYSTKNARVFINGVLDKIVDNFKKEGKIKKVGRGLI